MQQWEFDRITIFPNLLDVDLNLFLVTFQLHLEFRIIFQLIHQYTKQEYSSKFRLILKLTILIQTCNFYKIDVNNLSLVKHELQGEFLHETFDEVNQINVSKLQQEKHL